MSYRRPLPSFGPEASREAPIAAWLHIGPQSLATVCVSFPGTYGKNITLTKVQAQRLLAGLEIAVDILSRDDGDRRGRDSINLLEGLDA